MFVLTDCEDGEDRGVGHKAGECGAPDAEGEDGACGRKGVSPVHLGVELDGFLRGREIGGDGGEEEEAGDDVDDDQIYHEPAIQIIQHESSLTTYSGVHIYFVGVGKTRFSWNM